jgi:hypothetical protein
MHLIPCLMLWNAKTVLDCCDCQRTCSQKLLHRADVNATARQLRFPAGTRISASKHPAVHNSVHAVLIARESADLIDPDAWQISTWIGNPASVSQATLDTVLGMHGSPALRQHDSVYSEQGRPAAACQWLQGVPVIYNNGVEGNKVCLCTASLLSQALTCTAHVPGAQQHSCAR